MPLRRSWTIVAILIILLGLIIAVGYLGGPHVAVLATARVLIMATVARLLAQYRRRRSARRARADVAHACTVLASYLRVGHQVPSAALAVAAADCDVLREGHQAHTLGGDVVGVWRQQAQRAGHKGLLELARAWQIAVETGAPMSSKLDQVATSLSADEELSRVVNSELTAARATSKVMAALPRAASASAICWEVIQLAGCWPSQPAGPAYWLEYSWRALVCCGLRLWRDAPQRMDKPWLLH
jgi:tight adherence protein B